MQTKFLKRQKLGNDPYLKQQTIFQSQVIPTILTHKINRLNNSHYSPQLTFYQHDFEQQNKALKQQIKSLQQRSLNKQTKYLLQIYNLKVVLEQKQSKISWFQQRILLLQEQSQEKNQSFKVRLAEYEQIVRQLQRKYMRSSAQDMIQTQRKQKLNLTQLNNQQVLIKLATCEKSSPTNSKDSSAALSKANNHINQLNENKINQDEIESVNPKIMERINQKPKIVFNISPQKDIIPLSPIISLPMSYQAFNRPNNINSPIFIQRKFASPQPFNHEPQVYSKNMSNSPNMQYVNQIIGNRQIYYNNNNLR